MKKMLTAALAASLIWTLPGFGQQKKAVSIDDFNYSAVMTQVQLIFGTQVNIGTGINAMMTKRVQQDGRFTVVERRAVNDLIAEQDFAASNRVKKGSGARVGQIRGADLRLLGDIVVFGRDDRTEKKVGGAVVLGIGGVAGKTKTENKAVVVLDYRLVDVETSETVAAGEARGESKRESSGKGGAFFGGLFAVGGAVNMTSSNFAETIIGEAVMDAVDKLAAQLKTVELTSGSAGRESDMDARVADVTGNTLMINAGSAAGVAVGQSYTVYKKGKEVKDPSTGEVLDLQVTPIGKIAITSVREKVSTGTYTGTGGGAPVVGDVVRP
jgi:curli biogenesis system outer membrane secretion channel CsgG